MGDFSSINTALTGLLAHRRALEVISHNIANAKSDGYTRRRADLQAVGGGSSVGLWARSDPVGSGVEVKGVTRMREELLDQQVRRELGSDANAARASEILADIEQLMPEPSDDGIAAKLAQFWGAWDDAAAMPDDLAGRQAVLQIGENLATTFHRLAASIGQLRERLTTTLHTNIAQVNADAQRVAELNGAIVTATAAGVDPGDLQDQRDLIVDRIVRATGATTRADDQGSVTVFLGGHALVRESRAEAIGAGAGALLDPPLDANGMHRVELSWQLDGYPVTSLGGDLAAVLSGINEVAPSWLHEVDGVAASVVASVNALHTTGHGLDVVGDVNLSFFDPTGVTAATIALSGDVAGQPSRIALAEGTAGALDGTLAHRIAALSDAATGPDAVHRSMVGKLAVEVNVAASRASVQSRISEQASSDRDAVTGVNLDEELTNLIATQHAFEASSRVLTAVDQMLDTLINRTGAVGR